MRLSNCSDGHGLQQVAQQSGRDVANACLILETSALFESTVRIHRIDAVAQISPHAPAMPGHTLTAPSTAARSLWSG